MVRCKDMEDINRNKTIQLHTIEELRLIKTRMDKCIECQAKCFEENNFTDSVFILVEHTFYVES